MGHELVIVKERQSVPDGEGGTSFETVEFDMLKVKLRATGEDKKTVCTLLLAPESHSEFPLGDVGELRFEIRQQRLALESEAH